MTCPRTMAKALLNLVDVRIRRGMNTVLDGCSLSVESGQTVVLTGANGAGKSTLLEAAAGLLPLENGQIKHENTVVKDHEGRAKSSPLALGLTLQKNGVMGSEVLVEHLQCAMSMSGRTMDCSPFLKAFNLTHRANDLVAHLSQGQARKVAVLAGLLPAFASEHPTMVLLDEPDAGLDDASVETLGGWLNELRSMGHGLLIATHDERMMAHATHHFEVGQGKKTTGAPPSDANAERRPSESVKRTSSGTFGVRMHFRTLMWLNTNAIAGLLTLGILLSFGDFMGNLNEMQRLGFVLAPVLAVALCGEPLVVATREERTGDWWRAVGGRAPHASWLPLMIGLVFTLVSATALGETLTTTTSVAGAFLCFSVWHAIGWMQRSTQRLARPQAVFVGLLTPVLILPFSLLVSLLS